MKQVLVGVALIFLVGVAGFLYRNALERRGTGNTACTLEAKVCPDGSSVGRTGPVCAFAPCLPPNVEIKDAGIVFAVPAGYVTDENAYGAEPTLIGAFIKPSQSENVPHSIIIRHYPIPEGESATDVMIAQTRFSPSDMPATSAEEFKPKTIGSRTFYAITLERFEGQIDTAYYLPRTTDVLRFEIIERDVTDWMEPNLVAENLPEHRALLTMLANLQSER